MKIRPFIGVRSRGFILVVGIMWDERDRTLYLFPLPGIGISIDFGPVA